MVATETDCHPKVESILRQIYNLIMGYIDAHLPEKLNTGTLWEIPEICINAFANSHCAFVDWNVSRAFFITHVDEGILKDFLNASFLKRLSRSADGTLRVYMHKLTYEGILYWVSTRENFKNKEEVLGRLQMLEIVEKIVFLEKNVPFRFCFIGGRRYPDVGLTVEVTALSAGHNPGSVMLLMESVSGPKVFRPLERLKHTILYTGNCRVTADDLRSFQPLYDEHGLLKPISSLYIDTTYCNFHVKNLPGRRDVEVKLIEMIDQEFGINPDVRLELWMPFRICSFTFLCALSKKYKEPIHMPPEIRDYFRKQVPELAACATSENGAATHFHFGCYDHNRNADCGIREFRLDFDVVHCSIQCDMFPSLAEPTEDELVWSGSGTSVYFKKPDLYRGVYSANLSRYEVARVINFLGVDPKYVQPLHRPRFVKVFHVKKLIRRTCALLLREEDADPEPSQLPKEYPSRVYDFTGPNLKVKDYHTQVRMVIYHVYEDPDVEEELVSRLRLGGGQGDHCENKGINMTPDHFLLPDLDEVDVFVGPLSRIRPSSLSDIVERKTLAPRPTVLYYQNRLLGRTQSSLN